MRLTDFTERELILVSMEAVSMEEACRELVELFARRGAISRDEVSGLVGGLLRREGLGSSGVGRRVAIPHAKSRAVDRCWLAIGISHHGIDWNALDGEPADVIFLVITPKDRPREHLRLLNSVTRVCRDDTFIRFLRQSKTPNEVFDCFRNGTTANSPSPAGRFPGGLRPRRRRTLARRQS